MLDVRLYFLQRLSAMIMAPLVMGHIGLMIYAVQDGLSGGEILQRTQGSVWWALFYGLFVVAVSVHGAIGLRVVLFELASVRGIALSVITWLLLIALLYLGLSAVYSVTAT